MSVLLSRCATAAERTTKFAGETVRISLGRFQVEPDRKDWRFRDAAWHGNPGYRRLMQYYLAGCDVVDTAAQGLTDAKVRHAQAVRFLADIVTSAAAPTNFLLGNPAALKRALDTGGGSLAKGARNWLSDLRRNGGMPSTVTVGDLAPGAGLAMTPGAVVARDHVAELIQYTPSTTEVYERATLVVPPPIGRYYFLDLAPGRSFVEYSVGRGIQTFMLSWRNPGRDQRNWDISTYAQRVISAVDEVRELTGLDSVNLIGFCAGGILTAITTSHLAAVADRRVHSASFAVTLLDFGGDNPINAFNFAPLRAVAAIQGRVRGVFPAKSMADTFTWMRPNDLIWNYWVNNYLMGQDPPSFDILAWNADGTNLSPALHRQFLDMFRTNPLPIACARTYLGTPFDPALIDVPNFVVGAVNDHLTPWRGTYRTTEMTTGESTFVLSNAGHIAALVNPPSNPKASYFTGDAAGRVEAEDWRATATKQSGSWWEQWANWTIERAGSLISAPAQPKSADAGVLVPAPGTYVLEK